MVRKTMFMVRNNIPNQVRIWKNMVRKMMFMVSDFHKYGQKIWEYVQKNMRIWLEISFIQLDKP